MNHDTDRDNGQVDRVPPDRDESGGWFVYVVRCSDGTLYTGVTTDVGKRVDEHNRGRGARYTRSRRPVRPVYLETAATRGAAQRRESEIRRMSPAAKLALVSGGANLLKGAKR